MGSSEGEITGQRRVKPAGIVVMGWLLLGILSLFTKMVGYNFLRPNGCPGQTCQDLRLA